MTTPAAARRARQLEERRLRIVGAARALAEEQGWDAVTTRRLADAIEYSQPVLYGHFPQGRNQIVTAVALEGFEELAAALAPSALAGTGTDVERVRALVTVYLDFAERHPATYDAMFLLPVLVPFASDETPEVVRAGFEAIEGTLRRLDDPPADVPTTAEVLWAAVHGLVALRRAGRFPAVHQEERLETLVRLITH
ncbi:TetR/AcrR family transcriptional regulator [Cellulomonas fengjieae]|uniref:TetR/AcrR family transcriptional regulator n=1 Tax=Cellulomonas fengjieae TaxID=2819978 RepID=A0ABS3SJD0_9CELL|nr:TetR/AcrR family transcriptional regulator [Cellulomonas fengjieae]MBO3085429.1 TetR/AcrR family transcriptional regulator [Cellulomonas fengjieae]QVI66021.1 TetR/AcrR family transcriptional regulator [Cellulomonas fengjieae]